MHTRTSIYAYMYIYIYIYVYIYIQIHIKIYSQLYVEFPILPTISSTWFGIAARRSPLWARHWSGWTSRPLRQIKTSANPHPNKGSRFWTQFLPPWGLEDQILFETSIESSPSVGPSTWSTATFIMFIIYINMIQTYIQTISFKRIQTWFNRTQYHSNPTNPTIFPASHPNRIQSPSINVPPAMVKELVATAHPCPAARPVGAQKLPKRSKTGAWGNRQGMTKGTSGTFSWDDDIGITLGFIEHLYYVGCDRCGYLDIFSNLNNIHS